MLCFVETQQDERVPPGPLSVEVLLSFSKPDMALQSCHPDHDLMAWPAVAHVDRRGAPVSPGEGGDTLGPPASIAVLYPLDGEEEEMESHDGPDLLGPPCADMDLPPTHVAGFNNRQAQSTQQMKALLKLTAHRLALLLPPLPDLQQSTRLRCQGLKIPIMPPLIQSPPRLRVSHLHEENLVPRQSDRLAAKSVYQDPKPENQAKRVMLKRWRPASAAASRSSPLTPDASIAACFHETFAEPLSSSKRAAMCEHFPKRAGARRWRAASQAS